MTNDLKKLKIIALTSELQGTNRPLQQNWRDLSEMVLNRLILFNKRGGGETAKLHVETYINRPDWSKSTNTSQDVIASLALNNSYFRGIKSFKFLEEYDSVFVRVLDFLSDCLLLSLSQY